MIEFLQPYVIYFVFAFFAVLILYVRTYISEKAKIDALKNANKILVEETEAIKSKYIKELEQLKKDYLLDIEKRKYKYESKRESYLKFFRLLDEFGEENNSKMQEKFIPILDDFNLNYLHAARRNDKKGETKATITLSNKLNGIMIDSNKELIRLKQETNTIRLIASEKVINTLDLLEYAYGACFEKSSKMIKELLPQMQTNDQVGMTSNQNEIKIAGNVIIKLRDDLIQQMRIELDEI
jgi:hypothetical protein